MAHGLCVATLVSAMLLPTLDKSHERGTFAALILSRGLYKAVRKTYLRDKPS